MKRYSLFLVFTIVLLPGCITDTTKSGTGEETNKIDLSCDGCNVLLLGVELLRGDHVGLLNPEKNTTPNIDAFFKEGIIFEDASSTAGETYVSATATLTSTETMLNKHRNYDFPWQEGKLLVDHFPTITEVLADNGYYGVGFVDGKRAGKGFGLDRGFDVYKDFDGTRLSGHINAICEMLNNSQKPVFIYTHFNILHYPYVHPLDRLESLPPYFDVSQTGNFIITHFRVPLDNRYTQILDGPFEKNETNDVMYMVSSYGNETNFTYEELDIVRQTYDEQVRYIDDELSKIFKLLEEDFTNNTIVVLYANHGEGLWDNGVPDHGAQYQSNIHVPLLIRHPHIKEQIRIDTPVSLIDLAPTLYEMLGIEIEHEISGVSMVPLITEGKYEREFILGGFGLTNTEFIRENDWKLIVRGSEFKELYNMREDPHELNNLYLSNQEIARELEGALTKKRVEQLKFAENMKKYFNVTDSDKS